MVLTEEHRKPFITASISGFPFPQDFLLKKVVTTVSLLSFILPDNAIFQTGVTLMF